MRYTPRFCRMKALIKIYIFAISFISIANVVVKLKNFKVFCIDSVSMKMVRFEDFLGLHSPKYCLILLKLWPEVISNKKNTMFGKSFKIMNFGSYEMQLKFTVLVHFGAQFTARKPKKLLKTKISAKTVTLAIINNVSPRSQKNQRILGKLSQKTFFGTKLGLNCHHGSKDHHKFSHSL